MINGSVYQINVSTKNSSLSAVLIFLSSVLLIAANAQNIREHPGTVFSQDKTESAAPAVGFSSEPKLITETAIDLPVQSLLKRGVAGTVSVDVDIDQQGAVERCVVRTGIDPVLDSLVCVSMRTSRFSPAYEQGSAVPSTVTMSFTFDPVAVARKSGNAAPEISGVVLEQATGLPVRNARVNLLIVDTLADRTVTMPMTRYLELIGEVPGQTENRGILSTTADSLGRFSFRLLPMCPVRMAFIAPGFEIGHAEVGVAPGSFKKVTCRLDLIAKDTTLEIVVYGSPLDRRRIDIEEEQVATGLTHYLSQVLQAKATIRAVPESRSRMMVRAGSPFDNRYYICGVPMLAPFHFGGHAYADIDGMMISALSEIDLSIDRIAGRQIDASGFRLDAEPGIYRPANRALLKRPELSVDFSSVGQDFLLSLPKKETDDCLQLGFTRAERQTLLFFDSRRQFEENEYGNPYSYGNLTLTGVGNIGGTRLHSFSWLAWDIYDRSGDKVSVPWGMAAVTMLSDNPRVPTVKAGGARQYFAAGKRAAGDFYRVFTTCTNGAASVSFDSLGGRSFDATLDVQTEYMEWNGSLEHSRQVIADSIEKPFIGTKSYEWENSTNSFGNNVSGKEVSLQLHGAFRKTIGSFTAAIDLLGAGILYNQKPDFIGDAGVSLLWQGDKLQAGLYGGRITSRPDIRGLPDTRFRMMHCSTYLFSLPVFYRFGSRAKVSLQPYLRKKASEPKLDLVLQIWAPDETTALFAAGVDLDGDFRITDWLSLNGAGNFSRARRTSDNAELPYEWDIPWTGRSGVHLQFGEETQIHFYLNGIASKGMPFYDFSQYGYIRTPDYFRMDFSLQYRSKVIDHRFITRYDAYFNIFNLTDNYNASDYYWDQNMNITAIPQSYMTLEMGVRFGFRI